MADLLALLTDPDVSFFRYAFLVGILASISFGIVGTYIVTRRITYIAGAISHCVLGGIGAGLYLQRKVGIAWFDPLYGAICAALAAAIVIGLVSMYARQREDTVIGTLWAVGMAVGLLFIAKTPGFVDPMSYLFGNILLISQKDLWLVTALDLLVVGIGGFFYNTLLAVCFDEENARLRGIPAGLYYIVLLCMTALTIVLLVRVVGIVMVVALLTLPAAVANHFARKMWQMMVVAGILCMVFITSGLAVSYSYDLPSGPTIILIAGAVYLAVAAGSRCRRLFQ